MYDSVHTGVWKQLHALPSHPTLGKPQTFEILIKIFLTRLSSSYAPMYTVHQRCEVITLNVTWLCSVPQRPCGDGDQNLQWVFPLSSRRGPVLVCRPLEGLTRGSHSHCQQDSSKERGKKVHIWQVEVSVSMKMNWMNQKQRKEFWSYFWLFFWLFPELHHA